MKSLVKIVISC